jgi:hypothetical protein
LSRPSMKLLLPSPQLLGQDQKTIRFKAAQWDL